MAKLASVLVLAAAFTPHAQAQQTIVDYCMPGPYIVFFAPGSSGIEAESRPILDNMLENLALGCADYPIRVSIDGFTDTSEPAALSRARARVVLRHMRSHGVKRPMMARGNGANPLRIKTGPGVRELQNRRVEIWFGPPS